MARPEKEQMVEEIADVLSSSEAAVLVEMRGLTVAEVTDLRRRFRQAGVTYRVYKNTLIRRAADQLEIDGLDTYLHGPTAVAASQTDPTAPTKIVRDFVRTVDKLTIKAGVLGKQVLDAREATSLADLPTRQEAAAQLAGVLNAPIAGLARSLNALIGGLAIALNRVVEQQTETPAEG